MLAFAIAVIMIVVIPQFEQIFLGLLHEKAFPELVQGLEGYDLSLAGKMVFPRDNKHE